MSSVVLDLAKRGLASPPSFLPKNVHYEAITGSYAYGVSADDSDCDIYGFCIPRKTDVFPHLAGHIPGFGRQVQRFEQYLQHHIEDKEKGKQYDLTIFSIIKFFQLCMDNNPNMVDVLFVPVNCIVHSTAIGQMVRENRKIFLHRGSWHKFKGYAYSQLTKMQSKTRKGKRKEEVEKHGYDLKFAYHVVRLLSEVEQIMIEGDLDLQRNREQLKSIRRGEWTVDEIKDWASEKEKALEKVYHECDVIPYKPDEDAIRALLLECLEHAFGSLDKCVVDQGRNLAILQQIHELSGKALE